MKITLFLAFLLCVKNFYLATNTLADPPTPFARQQMEENLKSQARTVKSLKQGPDFSSNSIVYDAVLELEEEIKNTQQVLHCNPEEKVKELSERRKRLLDYIGRRNLVRCSGPTGDKALRFDNIPISVGSGTSVMFPPFPIRPDGSVDIIIQIRGIEGGNPKTPARAGVNAVVVTAEAGGIGSGPNSEKYGNPEFLKNAVSTILRELKRRNPNQEPTLGNLCLSAYSGGYDAVYKLLDWQSRAVKKGEAKDDINCVMLSDGMHHSVQEGSPAMQTYVDFAKHAASKSKNANGKPYLFSISHTAVIPGDEKGQTTASTTETAQYILNKLGIERKPASADQWLCQGKDYITPVSIASQGNFSVIQLHDKAQDYMAKDPTTGELRPNVPGTSGYQHMQARSMIPCQWSQALCNWNQGLYEP